MSHNKHRIVIFFLDIVNRQVGHAVKFIFKKVSIYPETIVVLSSHILWKGAFAFCFSLLTSV